MANQNGIITAPVNIASDIYHVLGLPARVITGTNLICYPLNYAASNEHDKINRWSKIKPVEIEGDVKVRIKEDTISMPSAGLPAGFMQNWTGGIPAYMGRIYSEDKFISSITVRSKLFTNYTCGIFHVLGMRVPFLSGLSIGDTGGDDQNTAQKMRELTLIANYKDDNHDDFNWAYVNVKGPTFPYRVTDFEGYCHNATCPISYQVKDVWNGEYGVFSCFRNPENYDTQIDLAALDKIFKGFKIYVAYFKKSNNLATTDFIGLHEIGELKSDADTTVLSSTKLSPSGNKNTEECEAYFFMGNKDTHFFACLPSLDDYPNPMPFTIHAANNTSSPIKQLTFSDWRFALSETATFFETFDNMGEGIYTELFSPSGQACIRVTVENLTDKTVTIDTSHLTVFSDFTLKNCQVYRKPTTGGTPIIQSGNMQFAKGETAYLYFTILNLFDGTGIEKATSYTQALTRPFEHQIEPYIQIKYNGVEDYGMYLIAHYAPGKDSKPFYAWPPVDKWYTTRTDNIFN